MLFAALKQRHREMWGSFAAHGDVHQPVAGIWWASPASFKRRGGARYRHRVDRAPLRLLRRTRGTRQRSRFDACVTARGRAKRKGRRGRRCVDRGRRRETSVSRCVVRRRAQSVRRTCSAAARRRGSRDPPRCSSRTGRVDLRSFGRPRPRGNSSVRCPSLVGRNSPPPVGQLRHRAADALPVKMPVASGQPLPSGSAGATSVRRRSNSGLARFGPVLEFTDIYRVVRRLSFAWRLRSWLQKLVESPGERSAAASACDSVESRRVRSAGRPALLAITSFVTRTCLRRHNELRRLNARPSTGAG